MVQFLMFSNTTSNNTYNYLAGVVFTDGFHDDTLSDKISYKLRFSSSPRNAGRENRIFSKDTRWQTEFTFPIFQRVGPREPNDKCGGLPGKLNVLYILVNLAIFNAYSTEFLKWISLPFSFRTIYYQFHGYQH